MRALIAAMGRRAPSASVVPSGFWKLAMVTPPRDEVRKHSPGRAKASRERSVRTEVKVQESPRASAVTRHAPGSRIGSWIVDFPGETGNVSPWDTVPPALGSQAFSAASVEGSGPSILAKEKD